MKLRFLFTPLLCCLFLVPLNSCAPDDEVSRIEAPTPELSLKERLHLYLKTEELAKLHQAQEERAIDLYMLYSRKFQQHDNKTQEAISGANRRAISNMIREIEASYPELQRKIEKAFDTEESKAIQELQAYRELTEQAPSQFPYKNEAEREQLAPLLQEWHQENNSLFQTDKYAEFKGNIVTELTKTMQARLETCHYYVGCYMGG